MDINDEAFKKAATQFMSDAKAATFNEFGDVFHLWDKKKLPSVIGEVFIGTANVYILPADERCAKPLAWWDRGRKVIQHGFAQYCGCNLCEARRKYEGR